MLQARTAEWVIIDLVRDGELSRAVVARPDVAPDQMIAGDKAPPAPLHGQVLETGQSAMHPFILDENALGITRSGQPVLTVLGAGSLLSVPLRAAGITAGVLTLVRPPEQAAFDLSDLRILEEIGELVALARRNERRYQHRTETVSAPQASLLGPGAGRRVRPRRGGARRTARGTGPPGWPGRSPGALGSLPRE